MQPNIKPEKLGPAAGKTWTDVDHIKCIVEWTAPSEHTGQVIYIPQNSLHAISQRPHAITAKIAPAVFRLDPEFQVAHEKAGGETRDANERIRDATRLWFELTDQLRTAEQQLREIGDKEAIEQTRTQLQTKIEQLQQASSLSEQETSEYQKLTTRLQEIQAQLTALSDDTHRLDTFLTEDETGEIRSYRLASNVRVSVGLTPDTSALPEPLQTQARDLLDETKHDLTSRLQTLLAEQRDTFERERGELAAEDTQLREKNRTLIEKSAANTEIETLIQDRQTQDQALQRISRKTSDIKQLTDSRAAQVALIGAESARRATALEALEERFGRREHTLDEMRFGLEQANDGNALAALAARFNQQRVGPFIDRTPYKHLLIDAAQEKPGELLAALNDGTQAVMKGENTRDLAADVLTATPEQRFYAEMEDDRIGGFRDSSMTPGKQALFALTLILHESDHAWPLLIDQPEDDLDSRSVYQQLVGYLTARKAERQIIMVSHNANLVIGADSEQIIVANRHGDDRRNPEGQLFAYRSGSLEYSQPKDESDQLVLDSCGIREHACELLDGGEEAFRKRKAKYKL